MELHDWLLDAAKQGMDTIVKRLLLNPQTDVNFKDEQSGLNALQTAILIFGQSHAEQLPRSELEGYKNVIKLLLTHPGCDTKCKDKHGRTLVEMAGKNGDLIEKFYQQKRDRVLWAWACLRGDVQVVADVKRLIKQVLSEGEWLPKHLRINYRKRFYKIMDEVGDQPSVSAIK